MSRYDRRAQIWAVVEKETRYVTLVFDTRREARAAAKGLNKAGYPTRVIAVPLLEY